MRIKAVTQKNGAHRGNPLTSGVVVKLLDWFVVGWKKNPFRVVDQSIKLIFGLLGQDIDEIAVDGEKERVKARGSNKHQSRA